MTTRFPRRRALFTLTLAVGIGLTGCSSTPSSTVTASTAATSPTSVTTATATATMDPTSPTTATTLVTASSAPATAAGSSTFKIEVWADNWMAVYVNGELVGEDSVPITTERSFNAETFTFEASYPFTLGIEAKDFKQTDSGIEYIGQAKQQMGDGGLIAQVTDTATGAVVAATNADWTDLVVQRAPLNPECEHDADPDKTCKSEQIDTPADWSSASFDASGWTKATVWSTDDVKPKDGYDEIKWDGSAKLIWGSDLKIDNTILFRTTVNG